MAAKNFRVGSDFYIVESWDKKIKINKNQEEPIVLEFGRIFERDESFRAIKKNTVAEIYAAKSRGRKFKELEAAAEPLIKYLAGKHHPHVTAIVTSTSVELVEGLMNIPNITKHLKD